MPHADLKYSNDLELDAPQLLAEVEALILRHDDGAGACKGRAYPSKAFHHSHALLEVAVLRKPHRDAAFMNALLDDLTALLQSYLPSGCACSVALNFSSDYYFTGQTG
ncbi:hypothetical protein KO498_08430 [Lentibacter algarum]|uniref:hypothetical protein n=1 Tax=Lentibacter algarum TaxID=576131 RepID=UPI001C07D1DB|nr:hypothetical protein [Lentibacter algarum]MBU2981840.1 hypothetical protein [Lentibacter algarum]